MVSAKHLHQGMAVVINSGIHVGRTAKVIDPEVVPDRQPNQRKVLVEIDDPDNPWNEYIIPKQLDIPGMAVRQQRATRNVMPSYMDVTPITSLDDHALDDYRPNGKNLVKKYVSRTLPGGMKDIDILKNYWRTRDDNGYSTNVGLVGDTQSGKTMLVNVMAHVIANEMGLTKPLPVFTLSGASGITDYDLFGQPRQASDGTDRLVWMEGIVAMACRVGGILYLDEVNAMPGNVTSGLHPVTDDRRQFVNLRKPVPDGHGGWRPEVVNVTTDLWIMCTYNPGYSGMSKTNEAFANRFEWLQWDYDEEVEAKLIKSPAIRLLGQSLRLARETRAITTPVGTSALQRLERNLVGVGTDYALWAFMGQFTNKSEKAKVDAIMTDRGIKGMLEAEFGSVEVQEPVDNNVTTNI